MVVIRDSRPVGQRLQLAVWSTFVSDFGGARQQYQWDDRCCSPLLSECCWLKKWIWLSKLTRPFDLVTHQSDGNVMCQSLCSWITNLQFVEPCDETLNSLGDKVQGCVGFSRWRHCRKWVKVKMSQIRQWTWYENLGRNVGVQGNVYIGNSNCGHSTATAVAGGMCLLCLDLNWFHHHTNSAFAALDDNCHCSQGPRFINQIHKPHKSCEWTTRHSPFNLVISNLKAQLLSIIPHHDHLKSAFFLAIGNPRESDDNHLWWVIYQYWTSHSTCEMVGLFHPNRQMDSPHSKTMF